MGLEVRALPMTAPWAADIVTTLCTELRMTHTPHSVHSLCSSHSAHHTLLITILVQNGAEGRVMKGEMRGIDFN